MRNPLREWPVLRKRRGGDWLARGAAVKSRLTEDLGNRAADADAVVKSICPYCAVGCGQNVYVKDGRVVQIEGDPDSPVSRGRLCPKGSATLQLTTGAPASRRCCYRRPHGTEWEQLDLDEAMEMMADRVIATGARAGSGRARAACATHASASPASAGRRSTTRRTT